MRKFSKLLENTLGSTTLRKVRLKTDPAFTTNGEISKYQGYEGFILAETGKFAKMYITECEDIVEIPVEMIDMQGSLSNFEKLKLNTLMYLKQKGLSLNDPLAKIVMMCGTIDDLQQMLGNNGITDKEFIDILKGLYE